MNTLPAVLQKNVADQWKPNSQPKMFFSMPSSSEMNELLNFCTVMAKAPFYQKLGAGGIMAIYLTAKEQNLPFMACLNGGLHTFDGKVTYSAGMINAMIVSAGHRADILHSDENSCKILFWRCDRKEEGYKGLVWEYTKKQAEVAGYLKKNNWQTSLKDMLYNRCLTGGGRKHMSEIFISVLMAGEMVGTEIDGNVIPFPAPEPTPADQLPIAINLVEDKSVPLIEDLPKKIVEKVEGFEEFCKKHFLFKTDDMTPSRKYEYVLMSAEKGGMTEIQVINYSIKNEKKFLETFAKWEKDKYPIMPVAQEEVDIFDLEFTECKAM